MCFYESDAETCKVKWIFVCGRTEVIKAMTTFSWLFMVVIDVRAAVHRSLSSVALGFRGW